ncbi:MarR family transcriptional regulator [Sebaldella sp. S0638]|uniref:MarR family transcriptional regulator n=1 Tax=Sebaldella sp. S0638 TaxID=2957809 RepID=UPI0020A0DBD8|nr:MarR family transcriptional regulator [Sebaldella sp. S0638]MCP1225698.1 MarR family transcriptional regulator [Sebaldella sp. S0638]
MAIQYKEYKVLDKDIGELIMLKVAGEDLFPKSIVTVEDIEEMKIKDFMWELDEILKSGRIIDFINTLSRNKLKTIIKKLVLNREELQIYDLHHKQGYKQGDIGKMLGVTRQAVNKKVKKMNERLEEISRLFED